MKIINCIYKILLVIIVLLIIFVGLKKFNFQKTPEENNLVKNPLNLSVKIKNEIFNLKNGLAENEITPVSASKNILRVFGDPVLGDLDRDGDVDVVMLLQNESGGSGVFYYAVLGINDNNNTYKATETMYIGDRIAPQTINIIDGRAVINYVIRKEGEPMTARPSIGKSLWVHYDSKNNQIGEWVKDFEGESR